MIYPAIGTHSFVKSRKVLRLGLMLGWQDLRQAYRRSALGPFWMTISMAIQVLAMSLVFSLIFKIELRDYLPWLTCSTVLWTFFSSTISESTSSLFAADSIIKQIPISSHVFTVRVIWKNAMTLAHNAVILPLVFLVFPIELKATILLFIPGMILASVNLFWIGTLAGLVCARYRDMAPIISSILVMAYYATPILWQPGALGDSEIAHWLLGLNPLYHIFQVVRQPILGQVPTVENWVGATSLGIIGLWLAFLAVKKFRSQIPYWV